MLGIILAGGRATRLGPLAAQLNKSLVTVGSKPMLVRQVQQLRAAGCGHVAVVVSPGAQDQVDSVIERAGLPAVKTVVQPRALGPGDALFRGVGAARRPDEGVLVLTADTLLDLDLHVVGHDEVVVAHAPSSRAWCYYDDYTTSWKDGEQEAGEYVAVGFYTFFSAGRLLTAAAFAQPGFAGEVQLSAVLNAYGGTQPYAVQAERWQDVGDVPALAQANRNNFLAREFHTLSMQQPGVLLKTGVSTGEREFVLSPPGTSAHLLPRAWAVRGGGGESAGISGMYTMEYVDSPSLAELWNYWPGQPAMWRHVAAELTDQLHEHLWQHGGASSERQLLHDKAEFVYGTKLAERYSFLHATPTCVPPTVHRRSQVVMAGRSVVTGPKLLEAVMDASLELVDSAADFAGYVHGDPTFSNVLWSLKTGSFKLLDPRGDFGPPGSGPLGDWRYDVAKIAAAPIMAPIMHGLFDVVTAEDVFLLDIWTSPESRPEVAALLDPLFDLVPEKDVRVLVCNTLLASAPLHPRDQAEALYLAAAALAADAGLTS